MTLTTEQLHRFAPACQNPANHAAAIAAALPGSSITNPLILAHFLGQVYVECAGFRRLEENLRYSNPERLDQMFSAVRGLADARIAVALWDRWGLSRVADMEGLRGVTRKINGPAMAGLVERKAAFDCARRVLGID